MNDILNVLYIEDEADIREMTEFALEDEGFELITCISGMDAIEKAVKCSPDLILIDMMMPGMDGLTTVTKLREIPHLQSTPVIFMTAKVQIKEQQEYKSIGAAGVISKPFDAMKLADNIREILEQTA